eukprot:Hpha_TRINITY_DN13981_c0_g1::TRINITY_DN13981_c0_g1_i4::g.35933::m.35933
MWSKGVAVAAVLLLLTPPQGVSGHLTYICSGTSPSVPGTLSILSPDGSALTGPFGTFCGAGDVAVDTLDVAGLRSSFVTNCASTTDAQGRRLAESDTVMTCYIQNPWSNARQSLGVTFGQGVNNFGPTVHDSQYTLHCCGGNIPCEIGGSTNLRTWYSVVLDAAQAGIYEMWTAGTDQNLSPSQKSNGATPCGMQESDHHYFDISVADGGNACTSAPPTIQNVMSQSVEYCDPGRAVGGIPSGFICSAACVPGYVRIGTLQCLNGSWTTDFKCTNLPTCETPGHAGLNNNQAVDTNIGGVVGLGCSVLTEEGTSCGYICTNRNNEQGPGLITCSPGSEWTPGVGYVGCDYTPAPPDPCDGVVCTARSQCHQAGVCVAGTGVCSEPTVPDGTPCDDGIASTLNDTCEQGACTGGVPCCWPGCGGILCPNPNHQCKYPTCDRNTGACGESIKNDTTPCDDQNGMTVLDQCMVGACGGVSLTAVPTRAPSAPPSIPPTANPTAVVCSWTPITAVEMLRTTCQTYEYRFTDPIDGLSVYSPNMTFRWDVNRYIGATGVWEYDTGGPGSRGGSFICDENADTSCWGVGCSAFAFSPHRLLPDCAGKPAGGTSTGTVCRGNLPVWSAECAQVEVSYRCVEISCAPTISPTLAPTSPTRGPTTSPALSPLSADGLTPAFREIHTPLYKASPDFLASPGLLDARSPAGLVASSPEVISSPGYKDPPGWKYVNSPLFQTPLEVHGETPGYKYDQTPEAKFGFEPPLVKDGATPAFKYDRTPEFLSSPFYVSSPSAGFMSSPQGVQLQTPLYLRSPDFLASPDLKYYLSPAWESPLEQHGQTPEYRHLQTPDYKFSLRPPLFKDGQTPDFKYERTPIFRGSPVYLGSPAAEYAFTPLAQLYDNNAFVTSPYFQGTPQAKEWRSPQWVTPLDKHGETPEYRHLQTPYYKFSRTSPLFKDGQTPEFKLEHTPNWRASPEYAGSPGGLEASSPETLVRLNSPETIAAMESPAWESPLDKFGQTPGYKHDHTPWFKFSQTTPLFKDGQTPEFKLERTPLWKGSPVYIGSPGFLEAATPQAKLLSSPVYLTAPATMHSPEWKYTHSPAWESPLDKHGETPGYKHDHSPWFKFSQTTPLFKDGQTPEFKLERTPLWKGSPVYIGSPGFLEAATPQAKLLSSPVYLTAPATMHSPEWKYTHSPAWESPLDKHGETPGYKHDHSPWFKFSQTSPLFKDGQTPEFKLERTPLWKGSPEYIGSPGYQDQFTPEGKQRSTPGFSTSPFFVGSPDFKQASSPVWVTPLDKHGETPGYKHEHSPWYKHPPLFKDGETPDFKYLQAPVWLDSDEHRSSPDYKWGQAPEAKQVKAFLGSPGFVGTPEFKRITSPDFATPLERYGETPEYKHANSPAGKHPHPCGTYEDPVCGNASGVTCIENGGQPECGCDEGYKCTSGCGGSSPPVCELVPEDDDDDSSSWWWIPLLVVLLLLLLLFIAWRLWKSKRKASAINVHGPAGSFTTSLKPGLTAADIQRKYVKRFKPVHPGQLFVSFDGKLLQERGYLEEAGVMPGALLTVGEGYPRVSATPEPIYTETLGPSGAEGRVDRGLDGGWDLDTTAVPGVGNDTSPARGMCKTPAPLPDDPESNTMAFDGEIHNNPSGGFVVSSARLSPPRSLPNANQAAIELEELHSRIAGLEAERSRLSSGVPRVSPPPQSPYSRQRTGAEGAWGRNPPPMLTPPRSANRLPSSP